MKKKEVEKQILELRKKYEEEEKEEEENAECKCNNPRNKIEQNRKKVSPRVIMQWECVYACLSLSKVYPFLHKKKAHSGPIPFLVHQHTQTNTRPTKNLLLHGFSNKKSGWMKK